jgi:hypothetical protein
MLHDVSNLVGHLCRIRRISDLCNLIYSSVPLFLRQNLSFRELVSSLLTPHTYIQAPLAWNIMSSIQRPAHGVDWVSQAEIKVATHNNNGL